MDGSVELEAIEVAFREHYAGMCQFVYRYVRSDEAAEDAVQDVWASLWRIRAGPKKLTKAYLYASARNRALHYLERHSVAQRHLADRPDDDLIVRSVAHDTEFSELAEAVDRTIAALPGRCRTIYGMIRNDGLSYAETAKILGISVGTVEVQMWRALKKLRDALAPYLLAALLEVVHR